MLLYWIMFSDDKSYQIDMALAINKEFEVDLYDKNSDAFDDLASEIEDDVSLLLLYY